MLSMAHMSDYLENKLVDWLFRGQAFTPPDTVYVALYTQAPSDSGGGTEVSGGAYARVGIASNTTNWSGTQAPGSTAVSSGATGTTSNNAAITFPAPTANWGTVVALALFDASSSGNQLWWAPLVVAKTINNGDPAPSFPAAALSIQVDS